jgi:hypothetical protein
MSKRLLTNEDSGWLTLNQLAALVEATPPGAKKMLRLADLPADAVRLGPATGPGPRPRQYRFRAILAHLSVVSDPEVRRLKLEAQQIRVDAARVDRKSTRLNSSH